MLFRSEGIPFAIRKGDMLADVGSWLGRLNPQTFASLPAGWSVLHVLTALSPSALGQHIASGAVRRKMSRADAQRLVGRQHRSSLPGTDVLRRLTELCRFFKDNGNTLSARQRQRAKNLLDQAQTHLAALAKAKP